MRSQGLLALVFVAALGCSDGPGPVRSFELFYEALGSPAALDSLSARARSRLSDEARVAMIATPARMTLRSVSVVFERADQATLEVKDALGARKRVTMVREDGAWRVDQ